MPKLLTYIFFYDIITFIVAALCNGSTADSDSVCLGSNPSAAAINFFAVYRLLSLFYLEVDCLNLYEIFIFLMPVWYVVYYCANHSNLRKQNIKLKMKLTDLALKTRNDIYAVYTGSDEDKAKIRVLKNQKNKIAAIRLLKENYRMNLFEAETYVDYL